MGLFGGGYDKPGKGVDKNAPKKKGFFLFWDVVFHKFTKFAGANTLYALTSIIWLMLLYIIAPVHASSVSEVGELLQNAQMDADSISQSLIFGLRAVFAVSVFTLWGSGPSSAAYAYITRCFTTSTPVWVVSDGWDKFKENFKQSIIVVIVDAVVLILGMNAIYFYYNEYIVSGNLMWMTLCYIVCVALVIYTMMHIYIYQLMVTFEYKMGQLYKNALILALGKLPMNLLFIVISFGITAGLFFIVNPAVVILFLIILGLCITRYPMEFYATRVLEKIIAEKEKKNPKITYIEEEE